MKDDRQLRNRLLVSEASKAAIKSWPLELRALFDAEADRALAEQIAAEKKAIPAPESEPPF